MTLRVLQADYSNADHARDIVQLMQCYANDPMGGGKPLSQQVCDSLVAELANRPYALTLLAFDSNVAVGLLNAFEGFSTFACKPLLNIHDVVVLPQHRGRGVADEMLSEIERIARARQCCKLTLEVLAGNETAKAVYRRSGFAPYQLCQDTGVAEFWQRLLV